MFEVTEEQLRVGRAKIPNGGDPILDTGAYFKVFSTSQANTDTSRNGAKVTKRLAG